MAQNRLRVDSGHADIDAMLNMTPAISRDREGVPPAEELEELPLPSDPKTTFLGGLFVLALLATAYVAQRDRVAVGLCCRSQAIAAAGHAPIGTAARPANTRGSATDHCAIRNVRSRPGLSHFWICWHLGSQASGGHSSASGAAEFHARAHRYAATVSAAGGRSRKYGVLTERGDPGARSSSSDDAIHRDAQLCQRPFLPGGGGGCCFFFSARVR